MSFQWFSRSTSPGLWCRFQKPVMLWFVLVEARRPLVTRARFREFRSAGERGRFHHPPKSVVAAPARHGWGARLTPAHCHLDLLGLEIGWSATGKHASRPRVLPFRLHPYH